MNNSFLFCDDQLEKWNHKINGTISEALNTYKKKGVPFRQLLSDYLDVLTYPEELKAATNPWLYINHGVKKRQVVCGVSLNETLFNLSAMSLVKQKPLDVIKSVYYKTTLKDDYPMEKYFINSLIKTLQRNTRITIINSSPIMVEHFSENFGFIENMVVDDTIAGLYSKQFRKFDFTTFEAGISGNYTEALIMNLLNLESDEIRKIIESVSLFCFNEVYAIVPTRMLDNKESILWEFIIGGKYKVSNVMIIPKELSNSTPKKKCFVVLKRLEENNITVINKLNVISETNSIHVDDKQVFLKNDDLLRQSILSLWKNEITQKKEKDISTNQKACLYDFSKEIMISYSSYRNDKGIVGKAYYAETRSVLFPYQRGKKLTKRVERGLHCKSEDELKFALEKLPYNEIFTREIVNDILNHYLENSKPVTLKTLWFCLRELLLKDTSYDDEYSRNLFSKSTQISNIYPQNNRITEIQVIVRDGLVDGEEQEELKRLKLINIIVEHAIDKGYLTENRVSSLITRTQKRASKRQSEVRNALSKKCFEKDEEKRIIKFVYPLAKKESIWLGVLIRLITGISLSEVCGICWGDYEYIPYLGIFRLKITKFVNSEGKLISRAINDDWEKFRIIPIPTVLGLLIEKRKESLLNEGIEKESLRDYPIISEKTNISGIKKGHRPVYCKPSALAKKCKEAITQLKINQRYIVLPEEGNEIITDINSYNGDIFRTNFRNKAFSVAGFEQDELAYYLGIKKPDTFSQYYCDYTNDYVQLQIAKKIERWFSQYFPCSRERTDSNYFIVCGLADGVACVEYILKNTNKNAEVLIEVQTEFGFVVVISKSEKR